MAKRNVVAGSLSPDLGWPSYQESQVERWLNDQRTMQPDFVAEEVPVALVYNDQPHVVMLMTPTNIEDFALGFSLTEGIIKDPAELISIRQYNRANGIEVRMRIPENRFSCLADKGRNLTGRTGCGLCGSSTLDQVIRPTAEVKSDLTISEKELRGALEEIKKWQKLNQLTGAVHAAAWVLPEKGVQSVREDVGRHNALDKLIGLLVRLGDKTKDGFVVVTSRASYEMVQKAASAGISFLVAMSAATGLAIRLAEESGITLVGFARDSQYVVYTHPRRLTHISLP